MSVYWNRTLVSHLIIISALCGGAWYTLVRPSMLQCVEYENAFREHTSTGGLNERAIEHMAGLVALRSKQIGEVRQQNELAGDSSRLYSMISALARNNAIEVVRMQPAKRQNELKQNRGVVTPIGVNVRGTYHNLVWFLHDIEAIEGFVRVSSMVGSPTSDPGDENVNMQLTIELLRFELPSAFSEASMEVTYAGS